MTNDGSVFEPSSDPDSVRADPVSEGSNVCRAGALSSMLQQATTAVRSLAAEYRALGFSESLIEQGALNWRERDPFAARQGGTGLTLSDDLDGTRVRGWMQLNESADPGDAVTFLIAMLGSPLERESAAAAAALWRGLSLDESSWPPQGPPRWYLYELALDLDLDRFDPPFEPPFGWDRPFPPSDEDSEIEWEPDRWREVYSRVTSRIGIYDNRYSRYVDRFAVAIMARARLEGAIRSPDEIARSLALAALSSADESRGPSIEPPRKPATAPGALVVSTMIHGTWGWKGDWWRPEGSFHRFILHNHRPNLYNRGVKFSWSGAYSDRQRAIAASDLVEWAYEVAPHGLQTVFGHSYGGEVAARAVVAGARIHELVLLSAPVTKQVDAAVEFGTPTVDIRLPLDPVLAIAGTRQRIPPRPNVTSVLLRWQLNHGATHDERIWASEDIARRSRL